MGRMIKLNEAIKISVEIDPKDIEGMHAEPETKRCPSNPCSSEAVDGGKFESYVGELSRGSSLEGVLRGAAKEVNERVEQILEDVSLREDKREARAAQHHAMGKVLREWRTFLRELMLFESRFGR